MPGLMTVLLFGNDCQADHLTNKEVVEVIC